MTSREIGSAAVIRGSEGSPRRPAPRPTGPRHPLGGPGAYLYWIDRAACLNRIRNALELVLDDLKIPKFTINRAKREKHRLSLHARIVKLERKKPKLKAICERMMAVKHLGNAGSHPGEKVEFDDVFDGFDILEWVLQDMYSAHMGRLSKAVKQINRKKGPRGSGR